ncbi:hypothetical protein Q7P35_000269 [Cladosporium inversicolor]
MSTVSFECAICLEDRSQPEHTVRAVADDNSICFECLPQILGLFEEALKNQINFPPRWGPEEISFESFEDLFPDEFRLAYREKTREYRTPVPKRVYCKHKVSTDSGTEFCNTFMGSVEAKTVSQCPGSVNAGFKHYVCMECKEEVALPPPTIHICDSTKAVAKSDNDSKASDSKEWTECPNPDCGIKIALKEGCNAITCPCSTEFCVLCGEIAGHDSDHWTEGKPCPRWGAVDAPNPMFDRAPIIVLPGFPAVIIPLEGPQAIPNAIVAYAANDRLRLDAEEALTLLEELASEQFWMTDDEGNVNKVILEMKELFRLWHQNLTWLKLDLAVGLADPLIRPLIVNPIEQAVETTNFFIRDEILQAKLRETYAAALGISGEDSVLFTVPVLEIFERYNTVHKPKLVEHVRQFVAARDAGRALWVEEQDRFARGMRRRRQQEEDEEDLPHRRASI